MVVLVEAGGRRPAGERAGRDSRSRERMPWLELAVAALPGLAAVAAVLFTWVTVGQTKEELRLAEHGQITNRFNVAAVQHLGSESLDVRLGGIYALQRIMEDSSRDHPTIVSVLSAYVREHAPDPKGAPTGVSLRPPTDIQVAVSVLAGRNPGADAHSLVDLQSSDLRGVRLEPPISWAPTLRTRISGSPSGPMRTCPRRVSSMPPS
ncbi:hypothetical protein ACFY8C_36210 [Streptomyces flavochromogenes]|uniref:HEAT repeat domain-containing protein n=1 Tax=Streptomyces flavochromogenes TaxID=68199 RepID=A0ABW6Y2B6_9ACTN